MFDFEYGYPYSSCYTERDLMYIASKSKSLSFNSDRFSKNAGWMGICEFETHSNKHFIDAIEDRYYVKNKCYYGDHFGTAMNANNQNPFFKREGNNVWFTIQAIFAGRDHDKTAMSIRESCNAKCLVCGCDITHPDDPYCSFLDRLYGGTILDFRSDRFEVLCCDCFNKMVSFFNKYSEHVKYGFRPLHDDYEHIKYCSLYDSEEQMLFIRFVIAHKKLFK